MLERAKEIVEEIAKETDSIILMHSISGKDSIALLDLVYPHFKRIVCVFMYVIPDSDHMKPFLAYAQNKYPKAEWIQVPHYSVYGFIKYGFMGCKPNPSQRLWKLADIIDKIRERTQIQWTCIGFKQTDSLNRLLMLRSYKDGKESICYAGHKFYPLSTYTNKDIIKYIDTMHLKRPECFREGLQSNGEDISDYNFLKYLEERYPNDLKKIYSTYPGTQFIIKKYEDGITK